MIEPSVHRQKVNPKRISKSLALGKATSNTHILIAGGGPVGLLLANLLGKQGRSTMIVERRIQPSEASMAIGITPPSLEILRDLDLDKAFTRRGIPIKTVHVFERGNDLGVVDFSCLPTQHRFILALPQAKTMKILRRNLQAYHSVKTINGTEVLDHRESADAIHVHLRDRASGRLSEVSAQYLIGCDGHRSAVRRHAHIPWRSRPYSCRFLMADVEDETSLGHEAYLYFGPKGSVESFPLPGGQRRWIVLQTSRRNNQEDIGEEVKRSVCERTGHDISRSSVNFQSAFQPVRALARSFVRGRVTLCGDAAHVMSPIGGFGMNTGFADAAHLAAILAAVQKNPNDRKCAFEQYTIARKHAFRVAANGAARGMWLGTRLGPIFSLFRRLLITEFLFRTSVGEQLAAYFSMLTIPRAPVVSENWSRAGEPSL